MILPHPIYAQNPELLQDVLKKYTDTIKGFKGVDFSINKDGIVILSEQVTVSEKKGKKKN